MESKGKSIASMSVGIVASSISVLAMILPFFWIVAGMIAAAIAIVCGIVAIALSNRSMHCGQAVAGLVTGIVGCSIGGIVLTICTILVYFFEFSLI